MAFQPSRRAAFGGLGSGGQIQKVTFQMGHRRKHSHKELSTLLASIEPCLNSRPFLPLTDDPTDWHARTPFHFVLNRQDLLLPENSNIVKKYPIEVNQIREDFWNPCSKNYLHTLQTGNKWKNTVDNIQVGSIVLIMSENTPPSQLPLVIVTQLHTGNDVLVRTVQVKTASSQFDRSIAKLVLLPV